MNASVSAYLLAYCVAHLGTHFLLYVVRFRHSKLAASERAIFLFHFFSAFALGVASAVIVFAFPSEDVVAAAFACVSAHGIYSLTFLELWTLAQISYSRDVLLRARGSDLDEAAIAALASVGEAKRVARLNALSKSGLVRREGAKWSLTAKGRFGALILRVILSLPAVQSPG